jgi:class 3 adenylate cyclase
MAKISIKAILRKEDTLRLWLDNWCTHNNTEICISDPSDKVVFGNPALLKNSLSIPLTAGDAIIARVWSKSNVLNQVWDVLNMLITKEVEKRKLGAEVLHLYQELNIIYSFAENLGEAISLDAIAAITLNHSTNSIPANAGAIVILDEYQRALTVPAISGEPLIDPNLLENNFSLLLRFGLNGQSAIITDIAELKERGLIAENVTSIIYATLKGKERILGAIILVGTQTDQFTAAHLKLLVTLGLQSSSAMESALLFEKNIREIKMREEAMLRINEVIKKFVPNEFISSLGKDNITDVRLGDQVEKIVTVLFTDIRDFTTLSERMSPEENFQFVSSFNEVLGPIIRSHKGFINQYLGDSIMAIFPLQPEDALLAAIEMQRAVRKLNQQRIQKGELPIQAGIGMHTGSLIMGITGDEHRLDAATISDTVNTAARIESLTKYYKSPLLLSEETFKRIPDPSKFAFRRLGKVLLKGKNNVLSVVECMNGMEEDLASKRKKNMSDFDMAMELYQLGQFQHAVQLFGKVIASDEEDHTVRVFFEKAKKYLVEGPPKNWNGAEEMLYK